MNREPIVVVGAGLSGLTAAYRAATSGHPVRLLAKGAGALTLTSGCIDVLGYDPDDPQAEPLQDLGPALRRLIRAHPEHPYAVAGLDNLAAGLEQIRAFGKSAGLEYAGGLDHNWLLPSTLGGVRPTCLAPASYRPGDLTDPTPMLIVGFRQLRDFYPEYIAANLRAGAFRIEARGVTLDMPAGTFHQNVTPVEVARVLDQPAFRVNMVRQVRPHIGIARRVGFPAVLGLQDHKAAVADIQDRLGLPVFEIPTLPPSVPGLRLFHALQHALTRLGVRVQIGRPVLQAEVDGRQVLSLTVETAGHPATYRAAAFILASGGLLDGGIQAHEDGRLTEPIFGLPVQSPGDRSTWYRPAYLDPAGHPVQRAGVRVDPVMRPLDAAGQPVFENLAVAGATVAGADWPRERSGDGVAVATGYAALGIVEEMAAVHA